MGKSSENSNEVGINQCFSNYLKYRVVFFFFFFYFNFLSVLDQSVPLSVPLAVHGTTEYLGTHVTHVLLTSPKLVYLLPKKMSPVITYLDVTAMSNAM